MKFKLLEDITRADAAFKSFGSTLEEAFENGAHALMSIMLENPEDICPSKITEVRLIQKSLDVLFYTFLQEFVYYKDAESTLYLPEDIFILNMGSTCELTCAFCGEEIDREKHRFRVDVKAVTMHNLIVEKEGDSFAATAVLDV